MRAGHAGTAALGTGGSVPTVLLRFDVHHVRTVGLGQHDADAVGHQLGAGLRVDRGVDFEPDGVPLLGVQSLGPEQVAGAAARRRE